MRLTQLKVANFRCFRNETMVDLDPITVIVGRNDSGKSSLFDALQIFFDEQGIEPDDRSVHSPDALVRISCIFDELPLSLVLDEQHATTLQDEHLLNSRGFLEIVKTYDCSGSKAKLKGVYARANHPSAEHYDDLLNLTNTRLKQRARELGVNLHGVNQSINAELRRAIWAHSPNLQLREREIELKSEDAGRIWDQLKSYFPLFALFKSDRPSTDQDAEAQDPMKAAVKEAIRSQQETLDEITSRVKTELQDIANRTVEKIREMDPDLASQLTPRVATKSWDSIFSVNLAGDEGIPINKRGSGTRRLVLLNFFRANAEREAVGRGTGIIYAIEEPETSQHPNNQKMLVRAFEELVARGGCQVLLTTHTPMLARKFSQESLRYITRDGGEPVIRSGDDDETVAEIVESLGVLPDHNVRVFLGVEGRNDIDFLTRVSAILRRVIQDVPDLGKEEAEGRLVFVPLGGSNLDLWVSRLRGFNRPEFYLMDRDTRPPAPPKYERIAAELRARPNCTVWITEGKELENYIPPDVIRSGYPNYTGTGDPFEDVPFLLAKAVHETSESGTPWESVVADPEKLDKKVSRAKRQLNTRFAETVPAEAILEHDRDGELRRWLSEIGRALHRE